MKLKYYEFKILLDENPDSLAFHAYIATKDSYRIIYDLNDTYLELFKKIISGKLIKKYCDTHDYFSGEDATFKTFIIDGDNAIDNINKFVDKYKTLYDFNILFEESNLQPSIGFIFDGPDYGLTSGMAPDALLNSTEFQNKMFKTLNAVNNIDFGEAFMEQPRAGSIDLNIHTTEKPNLDIVKKVLNDIINLDIDKNFIASSTQESQLYKKIIRNLLELKKFDNLKKFIFKIDDKEFEFFDKEFNYLFKEGSNLYGENISYENATINHVIPYLKSNQNTSSLIIDTKKQGQIHCHFEFNNKKIQELNIKHGKSINVFGTKKGEKTIELEEFTILP